MVEISIGSARGRSGDRFRNQLTLFMRGEVRRLGFEWLRNIPFGVVYRKYLSVCVQIFCTTKCLQLPQLETFCFLSIFL